MRIAQGISIANVNRPIGGSNLTPRTSAYISATGLTNQTIINSLNTFDLGLISNGLDSKMKAIYPLVTDKTLQPDMSNQMKFNFMNPLDSDTAFRLLFSGGLTFSSLGVLGSGVNGIADTFLNPTIDLTQFNCHISANIYTNTFSGSTKMHIGSDTVSSYIGLLGISSSTERGSIGGSFLNATVTTATHKGYWAISRSSNTTNGVSYLFANNTINKFTATGNITSANIKLFGNTAGAAGYSNFGYNFFTIGNSLTDTDLANLRTLQINLQTNLGR